LGRVHVHLKNEYAVEKNVSLKCILTNNEVEKIKFKSETFTINANSDKTITQNIVVDNPKLWSISKPNLYYLEVQILANNKIIDIYSEKIGISKI